ncbi:MAG: hypothetical protein ACRDDZ_03985 [Marinifilaceae bacterium]
MKRKLFILLSIVSLLFINDKAQAQYYKQAVGATLGVEMGASYKVFLDRNGAIETNFGYNIHRHGIMFSAVYQYHIPVIDHLSFYAGGGFNLGAQFLGHHHYRHHARFAIGIDPTVGFEYRVPTAPLVFAVDYRPNINFNKYSNWNLAAFKIRYIF